MRNCFNALLLCLLLYGAEVQADRIKDLVEVAGVRDNQLIGYGLVVGLNGSGDGKMTFTSQSLKSMLARFGVNINTPLNNFDINPQQSDLDLKNVAAVMVTADLPAFTKPGQRIDVTVSTIGKATSLRGGSLLMTRLRGIDGEVYAIAQGNLAVGGLGVEAEGSKITVNVPTVGRVPGGATVERLVETPFASSDYLVLNLKQQDFTTNQRIVEAINAQFGPAVAEALDAVSLRVQAPEASGQRVGFLSMIENLEVRPGEPPARVVVNSRTGTVVISRNVRVTAAAVTHGSLAVTVSLDNRVSQPEPFSEGQTEEYANAAIDVEEESRRMFLFEPGIELQEIVDAINKVGASPSALVAIMEALKRAGSLRAELIVI